MSWLSLSYNSSTTPRWRAISPSHSTQILWSASRRTSTRSTCSRSYAKHSPPYPVHFPSSRKGNTPVPRRILTKRSIHRWSKDPRPRLPRILLNTRGIISGQRNAFPGEALHRHPEGRRQLHLLQLLQTGLHLLCLKKKIQTVLHQRTTIPRLHTGTGNRREWKIVTPVPNGHRCASLWRNLQLFRVARTTSSYLTEE